MFGSLILRPIPMSFVSSTDQNNWHFGWGRTWLSWTLTRWSPGETWWAAGWSIGDAWVILVTFFDFPICTTKNIKKQHHLLGWLCNFSRCLRQIRGCDKFCFGDFCCIYQMPSALQLYNTRLLVVGCNTNLSPFWCPSTLPVFFPLSFFNKTRFQSWIFRTNKQTNKQTNKRQD